MPTRSRSCAAAGRSQRSTRDTATAAELTELTVGQTAILPARADTGFGETRLNVGALRCARADGQVVVNDASFFVRGGEIYGIAGVSGNGQAELAEALIGAREPLTGEIWIDGAGDVAGLPVRGAARRFARGGPGRPLYLRARRRPLDR